MKICLLILSMILISCGKHDKGVVFEKGTPGAIKWGLQAAKDCQSKFERKLESLSSYGRFLSEDSIGRKITHALRDEKSGQAYNQITLTIVKINPEVNNDGSTIDAYIEAPGFEVCAASGCALTLNRSDLQGISGDMAVKKCKSDTIISVPIGTNNIVSTMTTRRSLKFRYQISDYIDRKKDPLFIQELLGKSILETEGEGDSKKEFNLLNDSKDLNGEFRLNDREVSESYTKFQSARKVKILPFEGAVFSGTNNQYQFLWRLVPID